MIETKLGRFKVGDLVEAIVDRPDDNPYIFCGYCGVICNIMSDYRIGVEWEADVGGHTCDGKCQVGHGWYVDSRCIAISEKAMDIDDDSFLSVIGGVV